METNNIDYIWVAHHVEYGRPIAVSKDWNTLKGLIDDYMGVEQIASKEFIVHDTKYPDDLEGTFKYTLINTPDIEHVIVYSTDYLHGV